MEQKSYKFLVWVTYNDLTDTTDTHVMTTKEARAYAKKLAKVKDVERVELWRIDKTEIFV